MRAKDAGKGSLSSILTLTRGADGVLRGVRDIIDRALREELHRAMNGQTVMSSSVRHIQIR